MEPTAPIHDPLVWLAFVASATRQVNLATGILILPQRNPVVLAKQVASVGVLSGGRLIVGVGAGHLEQELNAVGVSPGERGVLTDEHLDVMHALWTDEPPISFRGRYTRFSGMDAHPKPAQPGGPRIVIGGRSAAAHRRATLRGHGWYGFKLTPEVAATHTASLRRAAAELGRPEALGPMEISIAPAAEIDPAQVRAFEEAGVDRLILYPPGDADDVAAYLRTHAALIEG
jgi:probable F420-dependent oxidoreductase